MYVSLSLVGAWIYDDDFAWTSRTESHDEATGEWLGTGRRKRSVRLGSPRGKAERVAIPGEGA